MKTLYRNYRIILYGFLVAGMLIMGCAPQGKDNAPAKEAGPLSSWNEGQAKQAILDFVAATTDPASPGFIPENDRIAVFDNDGTLWSEQPYYFQLQFALDRIRALAPENPEWKEVQPYKAILENDIETARSFGPEGLMELVMASHSGMTTEEFTIIVKEWIKTARHPETGMLYKEMVYQPMLEVLDYFRANGFRTWIVSGGGMDFIRPLTEEVYGIPPEQVVGSSVKLAFESDDGKSVIKRLAEIDFINDGEGKPVGIENHIGRRPAAAFGNSDGDLQMLQWTAGGEGERLMAYIRHTDDEREWAYDRESHIGRLDKGLDEATAKGWLVVDIKRDWKRIY